MADALPNPFLRPAIIHIGSMRDQQLGDLDRLPSTFPISATWKRRHAGSRRGPTGSVAVSVSDKTASTPADRRSHTKDPDAPAKFDRRQQCPPPDGSIERHLELLLGLCAFQTDGFSRPFQPWPRDKAMLTGHTKKSACLCGVLPQRSLNQLNGPWFSLVDFFRVLLRVADPDATSLDEITCRSITARVRRRARDQPKIFAHLKGC